MLTYQHEKLRRNHRNDLQIGNRNNCRNKFCPPCFQIVSRQVILCTCSRGNMPRANACPCKKDPKKKKNTTSKLLIEKINMKLYFILIFNVKKKKETIKNINFRKVKYFLIVETIVKNMNINI